jgi:hypothetical protein
MRFLAPLLLLLSCLAFATGTLGLIGCASKTDHGWEFSAPASNARVGEVEDALAEEQAQRQEADEELKAESGKADAALRADVSAALEAFETSPDAAQDLLNEALAKSEKSFRDALVRYEDRNKQQREALDAILERLKTDGGSDNQTLWMILAGLGLTGGVASGRSWGRNVERAKTNGGTA